MAAASWYLVYTKPQKEGLALENLQRQGYESYLPLTTEVKRLRGKRQLVEQSLFPRYVFVRLDRENDNWSPIRSTFGVSHLVRFGMIPAVVPDEFIAYCQQREQCLEAVGVDAFEVGARVRIVSGPFAEYEGVFEQSKAGERAIVLLKIADGFTRLQVESGLLDRVA